MVKIKITQGVAVKPWNLGAFVGDVIECEKEKAAQLVKAGRAEYVTSETADSKIAIEKATAKNQKAK